MTLSSILDSAKETNAALLGTQWGSPDFFVLQSVAIFCLLIYGWIIGSLVSGGNRGILVGFMSVLWPAIGGVIVYGIALGWFPTRGYGEDLVLKYSLITGCVAAALFAVVLSKPILKTGLFRTLFIVERIQGGANS